MKSIFICIMVFTLVLTNAQTKMYINKTSGGTDSIALSEIKGITFKYAVDSIQNYFFNNSLWEGNWWSGNVNLGVWFPVIDTVAHFGIDDFSHGQVRTKTAIADGKTLEFDMQLFLNSVGDANGDGAFFGFGNEWVVYQGTFTGIAFRNGKVIKYEGPQDNQVYKDTIGTFTPGQRFTLKIGYGIDGRVIINGPSYSYTYTPSISITIRRFIINVMNVPPVKGCNIWSVKLY